MRHLTILSFALAAAGFAAPAAAQQVAQAAPAAAARAGVAAAVKGDVKLAAVPGIRAVGKDVVSGDAIFLGDRVTTGAQGRLQIMLLDETVFTIGPNAALVIDQFVFDPQTSAGKVTATVLKGTFRFVTGKVAKREPSDMEVKLPVGSIGVRGTSVAGETDGTRATVVLLGPGPETSTSERVGRILVTGTGADGASSTVEIVRPGFGTEITGVNVPPAPPVRIDPARIAAITAPLAGTAPPAPPGPQGQGQQGQSQQAQPQPGQPQPGQPPGPPAPGQPQPGAAPQGPGPGPGPQPGVAAGPGGAITFARAPINPAGGLIGIRTIGALAPVGQHAAQLVGDAQELPPPLPNGPTTHEQIKTISSGSAVYQKNGIMLLHQHGTGGPTENNGTFSFKTTVDFGARTLTTEIDANYTLANTGGTIDFNHSGSYADKTGVIGGGGGLEISGGAITTGNAKFFDTPRNVNGKVAAVMDVRLEVFTGTQMQGCAGSSHCIVGAANGVPRTP